MWKFFAVVVLIWAALMPPFFTQGACTSEFDAITADLSAHASQVRSVDGARAYFGAKQVPVALITEASCAQVKPRFMARCGPGTVAYAKVPVANAVCRLYRDDSVKVQLWYTPSGHLARTVTDMNPYKRFVLPWGGEIAWAD